MEIPNCIVFECFTVLFIAAHNFLLYFNRTYFLCCILSNLIKDNQSAKAAVGGGDDALLVSNGCNSILNATRHYLRMLDKVGSRFDDAGDQHHVVGQGDFFERRIFMRVARIGEFNRQVVGLALRGVQKDSSAQMG